MIVQKLAVEGATFTSKTPRWHRSKVYDILRDRSYIGEVFYRGIWHPGIQTPLIDKNTFDRVQILLGDKAYRSHELTYAGELIQCGHCDAPITGEAVTKPQSGKVYVYYRCSKYTSKDHPRVRLTEAMLDEQVLALLRQMRQPEAVRDWFGRMLQRWMQEGQRTNTEKAAEYQRELTTLRNQQDQLVRLYTLGEIEIERYSKLNTEFRDRIHACTTQVEAVDRRRDEHAALATKVFELSQSLTERWLAADYSAKRRILEIICLNFRLDGVTLVPQMRKPFDLLVEGLTVVSHRTG